MFYHYYIRLDLFLNLYLFIRPFLNTRTISTIINRYCLPYMLLL